MEVPEAALKKLADADAFHSIGLDRRKALWEVSTKDRLVSMFAGQAAGDATAENISLPVMLYSEHVVYDYASISLSLKAHSMSFVRDKLGQLHIIARHQSSTLKDKANVKVVDLYWYVRDQVPPKAFVMPNEDETGFANLVIFEKLFDQFKKVILQSKLIMVE